MHGTYPVQTELFVQNVLISHREVSMTHENRESYKNLGNILCRVLYSFHLLGCPCFTCLVS